MKKDMCASTMTVKIIKQEARGKTLWMFCVDNEWKCGSYIEGL